MRTVLAGLAALVAAAVLSPVVRTALIRARVLDVPNRRSSHETATPRGGGIAVIGGVACGLAAGGLVVSTVAVAFGIACAVGSIGLIDDLRGLSAKFRLWFQLCTGVAAGAWAHLALDVRALPLVLLMVVWLVAFTNAFNFMDGINGISGSQLTIAGLAWVVAGLAVDSTLVVIVGAVTAGAALGFLPFNFPVARLFMGDVGSYFSGSWLALMVAQCLVAGVPLFAAVAPVSIYLVDTSTTLIGRARRGVDLTSPHQSHVYQRLFLGGWSHARVTSFYTGSASLVAACGLVSTLTIPVAEVIAMLVALGVVSLYLLAPRVFVK